MTVYADSSALVKIYVDEPDCEVIRTVPFMVVSQLARVEVPSALWHKMRLGDINDKQAELLVAGFEADYHGTEDEDSKFGVVGVDKVITEAAARLARRHGMRSLDAIQLASAILAAEADPDISVFAAWGKKLRAAAEKEGFALLPG
ncbi:VapC toxin family PIN domain ribonuclease [Actinosynnema sp. ALI-1.44]|uniref:type II toxin-antitoxin system VapC family toxin n=1 Tax=Actinosynnema sp. ALI-1.44 TaxID=1933779 RepID=UPI00097CB22B|nr:type II toxin-antitoxin system VapC family toxin [Actinosynnema sp. ALI-1.44]ONI77205.1 VapC toxin family PIN domain ribonuclease [Actinosynnema sp. ALI-1.44]